MELGYETQNEYFITKYNIAFPDKSYCLYAEEMCDT